jgi:glycolate oxidase FAD binding subunit
MLALADTAALVDLVREAHSSATPLYPVGGGTALDYGLPPNKPGWSVELGGLSQVVDYPWQDMTITVEAGITMQALAETLAANRQRLPIDAPLAERATLGGLIAVNYSGPRRYGQGTLRDYVIGISAVDGTGRLFKSGGRVVKNVAGYDLCKLLVGSLGTVGIITQVTLKVRPIPEAAALAIARPRDLPAADAILASLSCSQTTPTAVELLAGRQFAGQPVVIVGYEGSQAEVAWQVDTLKNEIPDGQLVEPLASVADAAQQPAAWQELIEFAELDDGSPLVVKFTVLPSAVCSTIGRLLEFDPAATIQAHAGNGVVVVRFSSVPSAGVSKFLISQLQPLAQRGGGHVVVWSCATPDELTRNAWWGGVRAETALMQRVKQQFDPKQIMNPGRFNYEST